MDNGTRIRFFRRQIPQFACLPGCHDGCGPVLASTNELARLPRKSEAERAPWPGGHARTWASTGARCTTSGRW